MTRLYHSRHYLRFGGYSSVTVRIMCVTVSLHTDLDPRADEGKIKTKLDKILIFGRVFVTLGCFVFCVLDL